MPRGRFNYSRFGGYSGYGADMGDPASSTGGKALQQMTTMSAPRQPADDPLWGDIESTFQDILGEYANMDLDMPIQPPDMNDPQDQMRYLKDLESLGMSSAPSAALMGSNIKAAMDLIGAQAAAQKQSMDMVFKLLPALEGNPDLQSFFAAGLMNQLMPGQFDLKDKPGLEYGPPDKMVSRLTPENATEGELYKGIATMTVPKVTELYTAGDKQGMSDYLDTLLEQLMAGNINEAVAITIINKIHADAIGAAKAGEPVY